MISYHENTILECLQAGMIPDQVHDPKGVRACLYGAKHFVLDEEATEFCWDMVENHRDLLLNLREFAMPPFERMAIEMHASHKKQFNELMVETLSIWDHGQFQLFTAGDLADRKGWSIIPTWIKPVDNFNAFTLSNRDLAVQERLRGDDRFSVAVTAHIRVLMSFFLLMLKPGAVQTMGEDRQVQLSRGRRVVFQAKTNIKINLRDAKALFRAWHTGTHSTPRYHEVRGHFAHFNRQAGCEHVWIKDETDPERAPRWTCSRCSGRRIWRKEHGRGDASKGIVLQKYEVSAHG